MISVELLDMRYLQEITGIEEWSAEEPRAAKPLFEIAPEHWASVLINTACHPGRHDIFLPAAFAGVPEFFVVADNPALPKAEGGASCCIYAIDPTVGEIEVIPQEWFNDPASQIDHGYQWITCVARDPATRRLVIGGFRIDSAILDETGRRVEMRLPPLK